MNREKLEFYIQSLNNRETNILDLRLGIISDLKIKRTQKEVANMLGISQSYINRLEKNIQTRWKQLGMSEQEISELFAVPEQRKTTTEMPKVKCDTPNIKLDREFIAAYLINLTPMARGIIEKYVLKDGTEMNKREMMYYNARDLEKLISEETVWHNTLNEVKEWLDKDEINTVENIDKCIEIFCKLTDASNPIGRRILSKEFLSIDYRIITEREERRQIELIATYINKVFNGVPREVVINIIKEWYKRIEKKNLGHLFAKISNNEVSSEIKTILLQIDETFVIGAEESIEQFYDKLKQEGISEDAIYHLENIDNSVMAVLAKNKEILLYIAKDDIEERIGFDKIMDCNYTIDTQYKSSILTIVTNEIKYPKLTIYFSAEKDEDAKKIYTQISTIIDMNRSSNSISHEDIIEERLAKLRSLFEKELITEAEYEEKKKKILEEI